MADLSNLLAELGGDNPQNRAIAEGLQKQGIASTKDIGVRKIPVPGHMEGTDEASYYVPETTENAYFNKSDGKEINPTRLGIYDVKDGGKIQGNIFFHLNADDNGKVNFTPQWSPRSHGFLRDNAVGRLIMTAGKIIPSPFQAGFVAADVADKLAHGKVMQAIAAGIPYGLQQLAGSTELLGKIAGNPDFVATAKTAAGKIAEAAGAPSYAADMAGKVAVSGITAGLNGGDVGAAMLKAGAGTLLGKSNDFLKSAGDFSKMGIGSLLPGGIGELDSDALKQLNQTASEVIDTRFDENGLGNDLAVDMRADENGLGQDLAVDMRADENGLGDDLAVDTRADENGIRSLNPQNNELSNNPFKAVDDSGIAGLKPEYKLDGAGPDYVSLPSEGNIDGTMVDDAGYVDDSSEPIDKVTTEKPWYESGTNESVEPEGGWQGDGWGTIGEDDPNQLARVTINAKSEPWEPEGGWEGEGWGTIKEGEFGDDLIIDTRADENGLGDDLIVDTRADENGLGDDLVVDTRADENGVELPKDVDDTGYLPKVPPVFPPKPTPPSPPVSPVDPLVDIITTLLPVTKPEPPKEPPKEPPREPVTPDPLKGGYTFSWNKQPFKNAEKGVAYGQAFYGNHWNQPKVETPKEPEKVVPPSEEGSNFSMAEGGLMALDKTMLNTTFKPTMVDGGIKAGEITKEDVAGQVIQHMRRGGHVVDHKTHRDVHYLASKGEPVHHIVGFMNHRKRMAEGGITSHSLGSYSDGGHLLKGPGDGMSDDIPATIADKQPARLANEEFVIPADVVSHLGNGSSESGAKVLYEMMARIRKARTGNPKQGKQIDAHKLLPKV
jgi:hypothetical protein